MCGIFGVLKKTDSDVVVDIYEALTMLQHRGQDAAGMVTFDGRYFYDKKDNGFVREVFSPADIEYLKGSSGIGHVRYPTAGSLSAKNAQPFFVNAPFGVFMVHNGNITNTKELKRKIQSKYKRHLRTDSDTEILLNVFANALFKLIKENPKKSKFKSVFEAVKMTMTRAKGAYSVVALIDQVGLLAFRDPFGIRPLSFANGESGSYAFASEDVAFAPLALKKIRDVRPGEAILIDFKGKVHKEICVEGTLNPCLFEYIYLARHDSMLDGISVYKTQLRFGRFLSEQIRKSNLNIDAVMPVPDSARPVAIEIAKHLKLKYREGLVKNRYVGRTFIMPDQNTRDKSVKRKLNTIPIEFKGKNILLVDDSIVRGTTSRRIIKMCREAGARKVYFASAAPPVKYANVYGVDIPTRTELVAHNKTIEDVRKELGADALFYQKLSDAIESAKIGNPKIKNFEVSVFTGKYIA